MRREGHLYLFSIELLASHLWRAEKQLGQWWLSPQQALLSLPALFPRSRKARPL